MLSLRPDITGLGLASVFCGNWTFPLLLTQKPISVVKHVQ